MTNRETTAQLRELSAELRRIREGTGSSQDAMARSLGWTPSRLSRLETGVLGTTPVIVASLLTACKVTGTEYDRILALSTNVLDRSWLRSPTGPVRSDRQSLTRHDTAAARIIEYAPLSIPELLQTEPYFRAVLTAAALTPDDLVEDTVHAHRSRQATVNQTDPPIALTFYIAEHALRTQFDTPQTMLYQREAMLTASRQAGYTIRVVPDSLAPAGLLGGPFRLLEYADDLPAVQLTTHTATVFLQERADIATYRELIARFHSLALDEAHSRDLLLELTARSQLEALTESRIA